MTSGILCTSTLMASHDTSLEKPNDFMFQRISDYIFNIGIEIRLGHYQRPSVPVLFLTAKSWLGLVGRGNKNCLTDD